jgi:hypothetical protein
MQTLKCGALLLVTACILAGCESTTTSHSANAQQPAARAVNANVCTLQSGGANVLQFATPERAKCKSTDGFLAIMTPKYNVEFWVVPQARSVDEATGRVSALIVNEFKNFKPTRTTDLTVAGSPAKRLVGNGNEADDGDPGQADVIVFKVGDRIFVGCNHGEGLTPAGQQGLLTLTQSAQRP